MNPVIYVPKGAAFEYSPLAANLYRGCSHGCRYCYAPSILRMKRDAFAEGVKPRAGVLEQLAKDTKRLAARGEKGPVLLCFTSDPYQPAEREHGVTREAIRILHDWGLGVRVLTKNPAYAVGIDMDVLVEANVEFGVSLSWTDDASRREWEPDAGTVPERAKALAAAKLADLRTWVSIEPVIDPAQALDVLDLGTVDVFKVGKLNHDREREARVDWRKFLADVLAKLEGRDCGYYIKHDLWQFADKRMRETFPRERSPESVGLSGGEGV
jgi:DNA repair photolyase